MNLFYPHSIGHVPRQLQGVQEMQSSCVSTTWRLQTVVSATIDNEENVSSVVGNVSSVVGPWVAQLVKRLTLAQVMISQFTSSSPVSSSVLIAQSLESASDSVSPSLSAPLPLVLCLSFSKINTHFKKFLRVYEQKSIQIRQRQTGGGQKLSTAWCKGKDFHGEKVETKQENSLIGYSLSICLIQESLVGYT